jgi:hypothetical protein
MVHYCNASYSRGRDRKITVQSWLGISTRPYMKNKLKTKDWEHG